MQTNPSSTETRWNSMTPAERQAWLRQQDPTLRQKAWAPLVERMARMEFAQLTTLQQEMVTASLRGGTR